MYHNYQSTNTVASWTPQRRKEVLSSFQKVGEVYEDAVGRRLVEAKGGKYVKSTLNENTKKHIDIWWTEDNGSRHGIDVKMPKRIRRGDTAPDNTRTWVELVNKAGDRGWLYGDEEWISFVREGEFRDILFVNRKKLAEFVESKVRNARINDFNSGENYDLYSRARWGDHDVMTIVPFDDMMDFVDFKLTF